MSLNKLVGADCGGNNALVQLSNIVSRDVSQPLSQADRFVNEFMAQNSQAPQTFNMNALIKNMPEDPGQKITQPPKNITMTPQVSNPWMAGPSTAFLPQQMMMRNMFTQQQPLHRPQTSSNVQIQYINESDLATSNDDVKAKAQEYVDTAKEDDELAYNQFMSFMKKVSAGELNLGDPSAAQSMGTDTIKSRDELLAEMNEKYKDEWAKLSDISDYWNSENANGIAEEYTFTEGNVMLENKSALDIGKEKLKIGDIPGAVLCFEAAAQQQPDSAEAWYYLGMTQAENEQDPLAITALKKSLNIDPTQLQAYITLSAAYANENMPKYAFNALLNWLKASPKYNDMVPNDVNTQKMDGKELESYVKSLYLKAAQMHPSEIDPNVQNALGVVFNITNEHDKAVDCFKTALMVAGDDAKIWNRLGATLANSDRSEEAVEAYHEALNLEPGFIRARYNVGITCMNLGAHRQAAEHFLVALNQQYHAKSLFPEASNNDPSSSTIWTTLRMVISFMGEHDHAKLVDDKNLEELNKIFEIE